MTLLGWVACQSSPSSNPGGAAGAGGSGGRGGSGGHAGSAGQGGGSAGSGGAAGGAGGAAGSGGAAGGGSGGGGSPDASAGDATGADAGSDAAKTDAYVLEGPGPFGIPARPANTTCKPPATIRTPAMLLTATGCVDPKNPTKPANGLIPYAVASPLWSDGADKARFIALPEGTVIHVKDCTREPDTCKPTPEGGTPEDEGHFIVPVGTVFMKTFSFQNKLVETRLFVKMDDQNDPNFSWAGFSYQWNAAQTEATLLPMDGAKAPVMDNEGTMRTWTFPTRADCLLCHNSAPGFSLGPSTKNLNFEFLYPSGIMANQIDTLEHIGVFDAKVKRLDRYPTPTTGVTSTTDDPATLERRARSYLQANCSACHRPEGKHPGLDFRFDVDIKTMGACNVVPTKGGAPIVPPNKALLLAPGHPELSNMLGRMKALDETRMPQVATARVDDLGVKVIGDWIKTVVTSCPP